MERKDIPQAGVIATRNWLRTPNGDQHQAFWRKEWLLLTDKEMGLSGIKSSDRWAAIATVGGEMKAIIPGCEVTAFFPCLEAPAINTYILK